MRTNVIPLYPSGASEFDKKYAFNRAVFDTAYVEKAHRVEQKKREAYAKQEKQKRITAIRAKKIERREQEAMLLSITALSALAVSIVCMLVNCL